MGDADEGAEKRRREGGPAERRRLFEAERGRLREDERTPREPPEVDESDADEEGDG